MPIVAGVHRNGNGDELVYISIKATEMMSNLLNGKDN